MKLNEHHSKQLFLQEGLPVPPGQLLGPQDQLTISFPLPWVLKAQVLAGGRGKAGGIRMVSSADQAQTELQELFKLNIADQAVRQVRIEPQVQGQRELYLSISLNREAQTLYLTAGKFGGVDIESCPPETILVQQAPPHMGLQPFQIRNIFYHLELPPQAAANFTALMHNLYQCCVKHSLLLAEINPLVLLEDNSFLALDGKVEIDDHQVTLNPSLNAYFEPAHFSSEENRAREAGLSFHKLDGFVGLMVNGAGLAMATMDQLNYQGLEAANFLDLGGGAGPQAMTAALDILFDQERVTMIFINIFGGILSCQQVAESMLTALGHSRLPKPVVVRFSGHQAQEALDLLRQANLPDLHLCPDISSALQVLKSLKTNELVQGQYPPLTLPKTAPKGCPVQRPSGPAFPLADPCAILVQGLTGKQGQLHGQLMQAYGSKIVAGVTPGKGGTQILGVPVFNTVHEACQAMQIDASIIFVPGALAPDAIAEAAAAQIPWVICITDGIPQMKMLSTLAHIKDSPTRVIGPNCPGLIIPGKTKIGIMPGEIFQPGPVAIFSRSGTLTYECVDRLTKAGLGQSLCVGIGGDPFVGSSFTDLCSLIRHDPQTRAVVILGEIGGRAEEELGEYMLASGFELPVLAFIAGRTAPPGKRLGHAGAILEKGSGGILQKLQSMAQAGFQIVEDLDDLAPALKKILN